MLFLRCPKCGQGVPYKGGVDPSTLLKCPKCGVCFFSEGRNPEEGESLPEGKPTPSERFRELMAKEEIPKEDASQEKLELRKTKERWHPGCLTFIGVLLFMGLALRLFMGKDNYETPQQKTQPIGISYYQIMKYPLSDFFTMEKAPLANGQQRYLGETPDTQALLEIIGNKSNISQASLSILVSLDAPGTIRLSGALLLQFLKNAVPEWTDSSDWVKAAVERLAYFPDAPQEVTIGNKLITMKFYKPLEVLTTTVKYK